MLTQTYKNGSEFTLFNLNSVWLLKHIHTQRKVLFFEIARLFWSVWKFKIVKSHLLVVFRTKTGQHTKQIRDFIYYSPARLTPIAVTFFLFLNFKIIQSILGHPVDTFIIGQRYMLWFTSFYYMFEKGCKFYLRTNITFRCIITYFSNL